MKICILKESLCIGGTERSAANISKILDLDHEVVLTLYDGKDIQYSYGGKLIDLRLPAKKHILSKIINNIMRIYNYKRLLTKEDIELIYEFISINNPISLLKHKSKVRIISARDFSVLVSCADRFYKCLNVSDALICNSEYLKNYYISKYPDHKNKVYTLYNMIDTEDIVDQGNEATSNEYLEFISKHNSTIVGVGRFCKEKGFEFLIDAFSMARNKLPNLGLVLIGDGEEYKEKYLEKIKELDLADHVFFTGFQKNPYCYMKQCNCFVLSSLSEGFPNVLAEAMALGLPVIATNCCSGPAEILRNDGDYDAIKSTFKMCEYGIISPRISETNNSDSIEQLGQAISYLMNDEDLIRYYSLRSKERVREFSMDSSRKKLNMIINDIKKGDKS